nr:hypothetical protein HAGR004_09490 [Bdellovibrio sp. HAGR004]
MYTYIPAKEESSAKTPVLVLMHGVGSNEQDLAEFGASLDPRLDVYSLRGPLPMGPHSYGWFHVNFTEQGPVHNKEQAEVARQRHRMFLFYMESKITGFLSFMLKSLKEFFRMQAFLCNY